MPSIWNFVILVASNPTLGNFLVNSYVHQFESHMTLGIGNGCALEKLRPRLETCYAKLLYL